MATTHFRTCPLCEATCGLAIEVEAGRVLKIRGDDADPFSRGYLCPKAVALGDLHDDPDRLRTPMVRDAGGTLRPASWNEAITTAARRLSDVRRAHGRDALGVYQGNPTVHNLGLLTVGQLVLRKLGTRNLYSATSVDQLPHMLAALQMFGHQLLMPVPDLDRCDHLIILGGNPAVSNGSIMTAPDVRARLADIRARGGTIEVIDPRRTETAALADRHLFLRPGSDALLLLSILHVLFAEELVALGRLAGDVDGLDAVRAAAADFAPAVTAAATGVAPAEVARLARTLATTPQAALYGRLGVCVQEHGGAAAWLVYLVNTLTGHLDEPGGLMFTTPAIDVLALADRLGFDGGYARWRSRVSGYPEFGGELPVAALAEEIETPGRGQVRALLTVAGNPVLSAPGAGRLERALGQLDVMVAIDPYLNETTRHADVILPPSSALTQSHYDLALNAFAIRNVAKYSAPVFPRGGDERADWEICLALGARLLAGDGLLGQLGERAAAATLGRLGPEAVLDLGLRTGTYGRVRPGHDHPALSLATLRAHPHGVDLGPLERRLPDRLRSPGRRIQLAPSIYLADLPRLAALAAAGAPAGLTLIGRRDLRSNNSWLHNSARLMKGKPRCTMLIHPDDATRRHLVDGGTAVVRSRTGSLTVPVEVTADMMPGVVSIPHGWGHDRDGVELSVARAQPGVSVNDLTDERRVDPVSGVAALTGVPVEVEAAP
jgi:anaerobic selenocysteine-containing dehydrogenase